MHSWVTQECREGRERVGFGIERVVGEVEVGDWGETETGRGEDSEAAAVADGGRAGGSRRGHQTDVPYSGAKAATWSSMRGTSGTSKGPRRGRSRGTPARGPDCFRVGSLRRDEFGVDGVCGLWTGLVFGRLVARSLGQKAPRLTV